MDEKNSQFILLKIPPNLVRLLGKIHALSIEVLRNEITIRCGIETEYELI